MMLSLSASVLIESLAATTPPEPSTRSSSSLSSPGHGVAVLALCLPMARRARARRIPLAGSNASSPTPCSRVVFRAAGASSSPSSSWPGTRPLTSSTRGSQSPSSRTPSARLILPERPSITSRTRRRCSGTSTMPPPFGAPLLPRRTTLRPARTRFAGSGSRTPSSPRLMTGCCTSSI